MTTSKPITSAARRSARIAAVQAIYQMEVTDAPLPDILRRLTDEGALLVDELDAGQGPSVGPDSATMAQIVNGVRTRRSDLEGLIDGALVGDFSLKKLEPLLRAILLAGAGELLLNAELKPGLIINDYVDVAHAFYAQKEPALVNGVLDKLGKVIRG